MIVSVAIVASYHCWPGFAFLPPVKVVRARCISINSKHCLRHWPHALGMMIAALVRSEFGTRIAKLTEMVPPVAYLVAVLVGCLLFAKRAAIKIDYATGITLARNARRPEIVRRIFRGSRISKKGTPESFVDDPEAGMSLELGSR